MSSNFDEQIGHIPTAVLCAELNRRTRERIACGDDRPLVFTVDSYQAEALRNQHQQPVLTSPERALAFAVIGITGELGEVAEHVKKHMGHDAPLDKAKLALELGDVLWYCVLLCQIIGVSFREVMDMNVRKLRKRFPGDWSPESQRAKADEQT